MRSLYLIDFSNFCYKFKSVYKFARVDMGGVKVDTSILYGMKRACADNIFDDILIVMDGVPSRSLAVLPGYKGQRMHDDQSSVIRVPHLETVQFMSHLGKLLGKNIRVVCSAGQETDEVISSIVHHIAHKLPPRAGFMSKLNKRPIESDRILNYLKDAEFTDCGPEYLDQFDSVVIGSTDGDFIGLQRYPNVYIDTTCTGKAVSASRKSDSTSETTPFAVFPYKAIYGDAGDNIPALTLKWKPAVVIEQLNKCITNDLIMETFKNAVLGIVPTENLPVRLQLIAEEIISTGQAKQFDINWQVAYLRFVSYPQFVDFSDYDISLTLEKYKIK